MNVCMLRGLIGAALLAGAPLAWAALPEPLTRALDRGAIAHEALSVLVLRDDQTLLSHLPERPMNPASTIKLLTTLVALEQLGPVFRGRTELRSEAVLAGSVLQGDLILRGGADADFSGAALEQMLRTLRQQGIRKIDGQLVLDRQLFMPARTDLGVAPFDEYPDAYYNVIPDALLLNKNMLEVNMNAGQRTMKLAMHPVLERVVLSSAMTLIDAPCPKWEDGWKLPTVTHEPNGKLRLTLQGTFPKNCNTSYSINVIDRHDYVDRLVRSTWNRLGGSITGSTLEGATPGGARLLAEHQSRALPEIVRDINKLSDNALARTLFLSLGSQPDDQLEGHSTLVRADLAVRRWMRGQGIDDAALVTENGSGLSRLERISARQLASVLQAGLRSNWAPEFLASMPIVAVDGTMRRRLKDSPAAGRARLKTGTLNGVVATAGYVTDASGQRWVVVAMLNGESLSGGRGSAVVDALIDWVARHGG